MTCPTCDTPYVAKPYQDPVGNRTHHKWCPTCDASPSKMTPPNFKTTPKA